MAFKDKYAITDINIINKKQRMSFSIDDFDEIIPVILLVPDLNNNDHDHVHLDNKSLKEFKATIAMKGGNYMNHGYYRIETDHSTKKDCLIDLNIFMFKSKNIKDGVDFLYTISLTKENIKEIYEWIEDFESITSEELKEKYQKDLLR